jgi:transcriptional regulator with XRE-family HTH domain
MPPAAPNWREMSTLASVNRKARPYRAVGAKARSARHGAKLTQEQAAARSGISRSYIARCESGSYCFTVPQLQALARAYSTTVSLMLEGL